MKLIIIDDEEQQRNFTSAVVKKYCPSIEIVAQASNVKDGVEAIQKYAPDLILLDVEMPDGTGFDLLKKLMPIDFQVIFITAHNEFAVKAFKFSALDYLLKPVDPEELVMTLQKAQQLKKQTQIQMQLAILLNNIQDFAGEVKKLVLKDADNVHIVSIAEVMYMQADNNYTSFFLADKRKIVISKTLKEYEQLLEGKGFFRCHQSHLINLNYVLRIDKRDGGFIVMKDQTQLPLSSRKKDQLLEWLENL
jgi:two-component system, LytTR family, response regulator